MIALRIIAGIVGLWLFWLYTFSLWEKPRPVWNNIRATAILVLTVFLAFAFLQFALAGHL